MVNTVIYLIRHSAPEFRTDGNGQRLMYGPDAPLSEEGRQKAGQLIKVIRGRENKLFDAIYSSPYRRAYETAVIVAQRIGHGDVISRYDLRDTDSAWAGTPVDELSAVSTAGKLFEDPRTHESILEIARRMKSTYDEILGAHGGQLIAIVSHGDPIRILYERIIHPEDVIRPYVELNRQLTLNVAQGLRLEILPDGKIIDRTIIGS